MTAFFDIPLFRLSILLILPILGVFITFRIDHQTRLKKFRRMIHRNSLVQFKTKTYDPSARRMVSCRLKGFVNAVYGNMVSIHGTDGKLHYVPISHILQP